MANKESGQFESLVNAHKGILISVTRSYSYCEEERKDLLQEILLQGWKSFTTYDQNLKFSTWFYRVALNVAISFVRKKTSEQRKIDKLVIEPTSDSQCNESIDKFIELESLLKKLGEFDRALILMQLDGLDHESIANVMNISKSNVGTRLVRIKEQLALMNKRK